MDSDKINILYVEDNPGNRMLIQRILMAEGYEVHFAEDAKQAMENVQKRPVQKNTDLFLLLISHST